MRVSVETNLYVFNNRKQPSGSGFFCFKIKGEEVFIPGEYQKAKKQAIAMAKEVGTSTIKLMP